MITAWRLIKARFVATAFEGRGAQRYGGRWNSIRKPIVYAAGSQALAALETLVHLDDSALLSHYRLIPVSFSETLVTEAQVKANTTGLRRRSAMRTTQAVGDAWTASLSSVILRVPSVLVPGESNYLLNPLHPDFGKLTIGKPLPFRFDPRLR